MTLVNKSCPICGAEIIIKKERIEYYKIEDGEFKRIDDPREPPVYKIQCIFDSAHNIFDYPEIIEWYKQVIDRC